MSPSTYHPSMRALNDEDVTKLHITVQRWSENSRGSYKDVAQQYRNRAIILTLLSTGITLYELAALNTRQYITEPKCMVVAGTQHRQIPITNIETRAALSRWLMLRQLAYGLQNIATFPLFTSRRLEPLRASAIQQVLELLRLESGVEFDMFNIRHTFILHKLRENYSPAEISNMLSRPSRDIIDLYLARGKVQFQTSHQDS